MQVNKVDAAASGVCLRSEAGDSKLGAVHKPKPTLRSRQSIRWRPVPASCGNDEAVRHVRTHRRCRVAGYYRRMLHRRVVYPLADCAECAATSVAQSALKFRSTYWNVVNDI